MTIALFLSTKDFILKRHSKNPILTPNQDNWWESKAVFNCGILYDGIKIHMLYRAVGEYENYISRIGYASSTDGITFVRRSDVAIAPSVEYEKFGIEDPRLINIDSKNYLVYVVPSKYVREGPQASSALANTNDYHIYTRLGIITKQADDDKDVVFFPHKIDNSLTEKGTNPYFSLHRPSSWVGEDYEVDKPSIWLGEGDSLTASRKYTLLLSPRSDWEALKVGAGPPPIKTSYGWLVIYHGVSDDRVYRAGAALLDLKRPEKILARAKNPILQPEESYEVYGDVNNVVFPTGAFVLDRRLFVYYGAGDKVCCLATADLESFIHHIKQDSYDI
ncbi:MAG TPA: hypothetical protein VH500_05300 [Nitrososphaeraceae archaeon]